MKAIIMAAGKGTRIREYINGISKCLVEIKQDVPLIINTINHLKANGITDITVIVGYNHKDAEECLKNENVNIIFNPFYSVTNSIGSLYFARGELNDDVLLANGDVFWEDAILQRLLKIDEDVVMVVDKSRADTGDYFFNTDDRGVVTAYGKELTRENRNCEYVGLCKVKKSFLDKFNKKLAEMIDKEEYNKWWENVLYDMSDEIQIHTMDVNGSFWAEVDHIEDYNKIKKHCLNPDPAQRQGGGV